VREALERRYREERKWEDLVDLYLGNLEIIEEPSERLEVLKRMADVLWREMGDVDAARQALVEALVLDPNDDAIGADLQELARAHDDAWRALTEDLGKRMARLEDDAARLKLAERVVRWARGDMKDRRTAERFLGVIRTIDPSHWLVHRRLASVYAEVGAWDAHREALERALARGASDDERRTMHIALGQIYEDRVKNTKIALDHYERALAIDPYALEALRAVERISVATESYARLAEVLDKQIDATDDDRERIEILLRLGDLVEQRFLKPREAAPKYEVALELDPGNPRARDGLERCWHALRDWDKLAASFEQRGAEATDPAEAIPILARLAEVRESKQEDVAAAIAAWRRVYELDTSHTVAIHELARLCERQGDLTGAAAYRARLADLTDDAREKARIHVAVGEMLAPEERDPACARVHFDRAVEMDPRNVSAWENLQKLAARDGDMMYATFCLERRAEHTDSPRLKAQLLVELAKMRASLGDARGALATYEFAFDTDTTNEAAAGAVLESWVRHEKWAEAQRACDVLVAAATRDRDDVGSLKLLRLSTRIALALTSAERALLAATAAYDLAPTDAGARDDAIHVCHGLRDRTDLHDRLRALAERVGREALDLAPSSLVQLGETRLALSDAHGGVELLGLALARDPDNQGALAALGAASLERHDWPNAANCKHRLARLTEDKETRKALLLEVAEIWEKRARAPEHAAAVLEEALEPDPRDATVLHRLVALWGALGQWERLATALCSLGDLEQDPARRAKHLYAMAGVVNKEIGDPRRAAALYEQVLDQDATRLDAFERVVRIWTEQRDWGKLEAAYRRMIARVPEQEIDAGRRELLHALNHQLGLVLRDRIVDLPRALEAFQQAARFAKDDVDQRIISELLVLTGRLDVAIGQMRTAARADPERASAYRELYELFLRDGAHDKAWCAANVLAHLGDTDEVRRRFVTDFPPVDVAEIPGTLASVAWGSHVLCPDIDPRLTSIFRYFVPAVVRARMSRVPEKSRMRWLGAQIHEGDSPLAAEMFRVVRNGAEVLGVPPPLLLSRPRLATPLAVAPTPAPALFVSLPAVEAVPPELLVFLVGRRLAELRPELVAHALFPTHTELKTLLKTALRVAVAGPNAPLQNADEAAIARSLQPFEMEGLREAVSTIVGSGAQAGIRRWMHLADLSISRAALLLTGDVDVAWRSMQREPRQPGDLPPADWRKEMLAFAVSDEYTDLRDAIGVNVETRG
jgi:tetratricopeptide (TPR) repeat protein